MRCISGTTWGNNSEILYMVYKGLIRSIFDYGCELYDSACITLKKKQVDIILAIEWLDNLISLNVVILSDSLSALQAISSYKYEQSLVLEILYLLKHLEIKRIYVHFEWIPSHIGLHGNDIVDQLANKATKRKCIDFDIPKNRKEHEHDNKYECIQDWQRIWDTSTNGRYLYVIQNQVNTFYFPKNLNRKDETTLHQLRLGKCPLNV